MDHYVKGKNVEEEESLPEDLTTVLPENFTWYNFFVAPIRKLPQRHSD
jgi:hypothetical protein